MRLTGMIPGKIIRFLEERANVGVAGTRDRHMMPRGYHVSGWRIGPDGRTMTVLVASPGTDRLVESLEDNGQFAVTVAEHPTNETYQLKGRYLRHRPIQADDLAVAALVRERFARSVRAEIPPGVSEAQVLDIRVPPPAVAVDIDVGEVYLQTPGPGAGSRLYPPADPRA